MGTMSDRDGEIRELLSRPCTIAIVGLSDKPERDSSEVARYLQRQGYRIVPVNPMVGEVLGQTVHPSVAAFPRGLRIDILDIFRRSDQVPPMVAARLARGVGAVWMQLGVENAAAPGLARARGVPVFENLCIMQ